MSKNSNSNRESLYDGLFAKPLDEIKEDIFFRADNFQNEKWYDELLIFMSIGVCNTPPEHSSELQKALKIMGYATRTKEHNGKLYILPEAIRNRENKPRDSER
jgi:hypothetical protein